jgi:hypothetical protein
MGIDRLHSVDINNTGVFMNGINNLGGGLLNVHTNQGLGIHCSIQRK